MHSRMILVKDCTVNNLITLQSKYLHIRPSAVAGRKVRDLTIHQITASLRGFRGRRSIPSVSPGPWVLTQAVERLSLGPRTLEVREVVLYELTLRVELYLDTKLQVRLRARGPIARTNETQGSTAFHKQATLAVDYPADGSSHRGYLPLVRQVCRPHACTGSYSYGATRPLKA